ncbi:MAG: hypothetical protein WCR01_11180 [Bacteroidota bacterium]
MNSSANSLKSKAFVVIALAAVLASAPALSQNFIWQNPLPQGNQRFAGKLLVK